MQPERPKAKTKAQKRTKKSLQVILYTPLGVFYGHEDEFDQEAYDSLVTVGENLNNFNTFSMKTTDGHMIYIAPDVVKQSILEIKVW